MSNEDAPDLTPAEARAEIEAFMGEGWSINAGAMHSHDLTAWRGQVMIGSLSANSWRAAVDALKQSWRDAVRPWIAELEQERDACRMDAEQGWREAHMMVATVNALRDALEMVSGSCTCGCHGRADEALATTPRANLAAYRKSVLEQAAQVAFAVRAPKSIGRDHGQHHEAGAQSAAAAIRALAAQEEETK